VSTEQVLPGWFLKATTEHPEPPEDLGAIASTFLGLLYADADWYEVQQELKSLSRDNSIAGIEQRQQEALLGIVNSFRREAPDPAKIAAVQKTRENNERSLATELRATEEEFRAHIAELSTELTEAAKAAEKTPKDSSVAQAASRIGRAVGNADLSKLGPYWLLIVLYWLIVHLTVNQVAALTLWYMMVSDTFKKKD
jgi:hypothetical protein